MGLWRNKQQQQPHNRLPDRLTSLALSLSLPLSFSLHSFPPSHSALSMPNLLPLHRNQKWTSHRLHIADVALSPPLPLSLSDDFNHSCSYHTRVGIRDVQRSCGRCSFACSFLLSGSFLACCSVLVGWALRVALVRPHSGNFGFAPLGPTPNGNRCCRDDDASQSQAEAKAAAKATDQRVWERESEREAAR